MSEVTTMPMPASRAEPVVRDAPLGGGALSLALQAGATPPEWMRERPTTGAEWAKVALAARQRHAARPWLSPIAAAFNATGEAAQRLSRAAAGGVVVTTGQQPGLFGGPAYTWSKAMAALALADELEAKLGIPVAPIFWAATDDADWQEAAVTYVVGENGLETLTLHGDATDGVALAEVPLGNIEAEIARLRAACGSAAQADILELVESAYVPHATVGAAYVQLLRGVLEPLGIAVLDAGHPAFRAASDPLLRQALTSAAAVGAALQSRTNAIRAAGFAPQVEDVAGLSLVFRTTRSERGNTRERVPITLAARTVREAEVGTLGSNVLLRPVVERALLPTIAYVAGPGEYAYFAQVSPIAEVLGLDVPLAVPRWAGTVLEPHTARALQRLGVSEDEFADRHGVETRLAKEALDETVADALERLRVATETQLRALQGAVSAAEELAPRSVVDGAGRDLRHTFDRLERRLVASVKRREAALMRDVAIARAAIRPLGQSPERVLNLVPALARYGTALLLAMRDRARVHAAALVTGDSTAAE